MNITSSDDTTNRKRLLTGWLATTILSGTQGKRGVRFRPLGRLTPAPPSGRLSGGHFPASESRFSKKNHTLAPQALLGPPWGVATAQRFLSSPQNDPPVGPMLRLKTQLILTSRPFHDITARSCLIANFCFPRVRRRFVGMCPLRHQSSFITCFTNLFKRLCV